MHGYGIGPVEHFTIMLANIRRVPVRRSGLVAKLDRIIQMPCTILAAMNGVVSAQMRRARDLDQIAVSITNAAPVLVFLHL